MEELFFSINRGDFTMPCPEARIVLAPSYLTVAFEGSGIIRANKAGFFEYELMVSTDNQQWIQELNPHIPRNEPPLYFQLQIIDQNGREWRGGDWVRPKIYNIFSSKVGKTFAITGKLKTFTSANIEGFVSHKNEKDLYKFIIPNAGWIPWTGWKTTTIKNAEGAEESIVREPCYKSINIEGISITLEKLNDTNHIVTTISSDSDELPPFIDIKVLEALQFITGRLIHFGVSLRKGKNQNCIHIVAQHNHLKTKHVPPIALSEPQQFTTYWEAYTSLLKYLIINDSKNPSFHPFIEAIISVMEAGSRGEAIRSLTLAVAIEAIILCCTKSNPDKKEAFSEEKTKELERLEKEIQELKSFINDNITSTTFIKRITGAINKIHGNSWSAVDRLQKLKREGIITTQQYKSWNMLRHPSVHGEFTRISNKRNYEDLLGDVYTLAHTLILREVGYEGYITNYGCQDNKGT